MDIFLYSASLIHNFFSMHCNLQSPKSLLYGKISGSQMQLSMILLHVSTALLQHKVTIKKFKKYPNNMQKFDRHFFFTFASVFCQFISYNRRRRSSISKIAFWELIKLALENLVLKCLHLAVVKGDRLHQGGVQASKFLNKIKSM